MKNEDRYLNSIAAVLFISAIIFNVVAAIIHSGRIQNICWEIGSLAAVSGYAMMAGKLIREKHDLLAVGFNILVVAEAFAMASVANPERLDDVSFGACLALYIPGFLIIGIYSHFSWWSRMACILLCIPFGIETFNILNGIKIDYTSALQQAGYILQTIVFIGWIIKLLKRPQLK